MKPAPPVTKDVAIYDRRPVPAHTSDIVSGRMDSICLTSSNGVRLRDVHVVVDGAQFPRRRRGGAAERPRRRVEGLLEALLADATA
jgi:hypothetical protein